MKKTLTTLFLALTMLTATAAERTSSAMQEIARQQLSGINGGRRAISQDDMELKRVLNKPTLSIYTGEQGFAIISRDDRFQPVLAYGTGMFDVNNMSEGLKWWLGAVQAQMESDIRMNREPRRAEAAYEPIAPMVKSKWGQDTPYNNYCPVFEKDKTKAPVGCVATAMAQIINFHQYPTSVSFSGSYTINGATTEVAVDRKYTFPYLDAYGYYLPDGATEYVNASYTPRQGNLVAYLSLDCGYAINMNYTVSGSGAYTYDAAKALVSCFSYPEASITNLFRELYTAEEWMDIIHSELALGYPVIYAGSSEQSGGHAFIFHGMDAQGLVYVNWGWQGSDDGYYAFYGLNPGDDDFNDGQQMITGIRPEALPTDHFRSVIGADEPYSFSYDNEAKKFTIDISEGIYNFHYDTFKGSLRVVAENLTDPDNSADIRLNDEGDPYEIRSLYGISGTASMEGEFAPGKYNLYMEAKEKRDADWQMIRVSGIGILKYDMTVADNGTVTIGSNPVVTGIRDIRETTLNDSNHPVRYFDLNGREVSSSAKGLLIRKQGSSVTKVVK